MQSANLLPNSRLYKKKEGKEEQRERREERGGGKEGKRRKEGRKDGRTDGWTDEETDLYCPFIVTGFSPLSSSSPLTKFISMCIETILKALL